jgi:hypothetical protein
MVRASTNSTSDARNAGNAAMTRFMLFEDHVSYGSRASLAAVRDRRRAPSGAGHITAAFFERTVLG